MIFSGSEYTPGSVGALFLIHLNSSLYLVMTRKIITINTNTSRYKRLKTGSVIILFDRFSFGSSLGISVSKGRFRPLADINEIA